MQTELARLKNKVDACLAGMFSDTPAPTLAEAMQYSLLAGGKRIRPVIALAFCKACGGEADTVLKAACALEMLHTYSLIHDDLPCMDDDDLRRGKPTNHVVFGECTATLAGDCLQAEAFKLLLSSDLPSERVVKMASYLANAAGIYGICGGQELDMLGESKTLSEEELTQIHSLKTASLLVACAKIGVAAAGGSAVQLSAAEKYAEALGLAFQIRDDILDVTSDTATLGKPVGSDAENDKNTFVTLYGIEKCQQLVLENTEKAKAAIKDVFEKGAFLAWLADYLAGRTK